MKEKGFTSLLIVILIALAVGGYLFYQKQAKLIPQPVIQPSSSPLISRVASDSAETANPDSIGVSWKIYTNNKYGYYFKYPQNFSVSENFDPNGNIELTIISNTDNKDFTGGRKSINDPDVFYAVIVNAIQNNTDLVTLRSQYISTQYVTYALSDYVIGGQPGFKVIATGPGPTVTKVVAVYKGQEYDFNFPFTSSQLVSYFDQILSTFKFLPTPNQNNTEMFCGGFAGKLCPVGYICKLDGNYPDAGGKCIKE